MAERTEQESETEQPEGTEEAAPGRRRRRPRRSPARRALVAGSVVLALLLVLSVVVVWQVAGATQSLLTVKPAFWSSRVQVADVRDDRITITTVPGGPTWLDAGEVYGLEWKQGWGRVGEVVRDDGDRVVRAFELSGGEAPRKGERVRFTRESFPRDGREAFPDAGVRDVSIEGAAGAKPAWFAPGRGSTWAILVHGRGSARSEMFRLMDQTIDLGLPSLAITYRGDRETGGGKIQLGLTEWRDVHAAVRHALDHGARRVVLVGASMGGSLIASFLERSTLGKRVAALVLDSPLLDFDSAVVAAAQTGRVPGLGIRVPSPLAHVASQVAQVRSGFDFDDVDYLRDTSWLTVPTLVLHGDADTSVPVDDSRRLAEERPGLVSLHVVPGATHMESWNEAPDAYDRWVRDFLSAYAPDRRP